MAILFSKYEWRRKLKEIIEAALLFVVLPGLFHIWFYFYYHYTYFDWYDVNLGVSNSLYTPTMFIKVFGWLFLAGSPIFYISDFDQNKKNF